MTDTGQELLKLMFNPGETICVSNNKYGYHSMPLESLQNKSVTLVSPDPQIPFEEVPTEFLTLVALNPILGFRQDANCYRFRNFLLELDEGELKAQVAYIKAIGVPYSAMVFSGGKSVHTLISLDEDIPSEKIWRLFSEWLLNAVTLADQLTKNPSRSIRIPGAIRDGDPNKVQRLIEMRGKVPMKDLVAFLAKYEHVKPRPKERRLAGQEPDFNRLDPWVIKQLTEGIDFSRKGRNQTWFSIACSFALAGYSEEETIDILGRHYQEERSFKEKEWLTSIRSGFHHIHQRG